MKLAKQDYEFIASILRRTKPSGAENVKVWSEIAVAFSDEFRQSNTKFLVGEFLKSCDYDEVSQVKK